MVEHSSDPAMRAVVLPSNMGGCAALRAGGRAAAAFVQLHMNASHFVRHTLDRAASHIWSFVQNPILHLIVHILCTSY